MPAAHTPSATSTTCATHSMHSAGWRARGSPSAISRLPRRASAGSEGENPVRRVHSRTRRKATMAVMHPGRFQFERLLSLVASAALLCLGAGARDARADDTCLVGFELKDVGKIGTGTTVPGVASSKKCVFELGLCVDQRVEGCAPGELKQRKGRAKGHCGG